MDRVIVTNPVVNLFAMQVCAVKDATDEEILKVCNLKNPAGTTRGWCKVIRSADNFERPEAFPVQCDEFPERIHFLVLC